MNRKKELLRGLWVSPIEPRPSLNLKLCNKSSPQPWLLNRLCERYPSQRVCGLGFKGLGFKA